MVAHEPGEVKPVRLAPLVSSAKDITGIRVKIHASKQVVLKPIINHPSPSTQASYR
jgi:hypothetical protein